MNRIVRTNGVFYTNIPDRVVLGPNINNKTITPVNLIGQHYIAYGKAQNENYLWLLENFAGSKPPNHVLGQKWFKPSNSYSGEFLLAPTDRTRDDQWLSIPVVSRVQAEPLATSSYTGRLIIQNSNTLKMLVNGAWRVIPTRVSGEQYTERLLTIRYNYDNGEIITVPNPDYNTTEPRDLPVKTLKHTTDWIDIARFNEGGVFVSELDAPNGLVVSGTPALRFGGNYFWTAEVVARNAKSPHIKKTWELSGMFSVDSSTSQTANLPVNTSLYIKPDPRIIKGTLSNNILLLDTVKSIEIQDPGTESWDVRVVASTIFPSLTSITDPSSGAIDVARFIANGDLYGVMFQGTANTNANLQWNIAFTLQGVPNSK